MAMAVVLDPEHRCERYVVAHTSWSFNFVYKSTLLVNDGSGSLTISQSLLFAAWVCGDDCAYFLLVPGVATPFRLECGGNATTYSLVRTFSVESVTNSEGECKRLYQ